MLSPMVWLSRDPMVWLSHDQMVALGWTLLHFCWQGTAVAVAYAFVDRMTSRATSQIRYVVALAALALMPAVVVGTFAMEMRTAAPAAVNGYHAAQFSSGVQLSAKPRPILH